MGEDSAARTAMGIRQLLLRHTVAGIVQLIRMGIARQPHQLMAVDIVLLIKMGIRGQPHPLMAAVIDPPISMGTPAQLLGPMAADTALPINMAIRRHASLSTAAVIAASRWLRVFDCGGG